MIRFFLSCGICVCLTGCLSWAGSGRDATAPLPATASIGQYHFQWKLSGNRAVAPLQVFDDGQRTWLQFPPGQPAPAIFARLPQGDQLLTPAAGQGGLLMLDGVWPQIVMRGGLLQSVALRLPDDASATLDTNRIAPETAQPQAHPDGARAAPATAFPVAPSAASPVAAPVRASVPGAPRDSAVTPAPKPSANPDFRVSPADGTLRAALSRWANTAGWTFSFEHWAVEVDIPVVAAATFALPFEQAVQELVASTELSEQPLRPCFYTNQVLRIVPHTQPCDRSAASRG